MSGEPAWIIPAITASASLIGTMVGGLATFWTSKKSFERAQASEELERRNTQLRDAAIRFVSAITEEPVAQTGVQRLVEQLGPTAARLAGAQSDEEFAELAREFDPSIDPGADRVAVLIHLMESTGAFDDDVRRLVTLTTELRLIAPRDVAESAQRVLFSAASREVVSAIAPHRRHTAHDKFNREINEFFNRVRHHMKVEDLEFDFFSSNGSPLSLGAPLRNGS